MQPVPGVEEKCQTFTDIGYRFIPGVNLCHFFLTQPSELLVGQSTVLQSLRPDGGAGGNGARSGLRALPESSPVSQRTLLLVRLSSSPQASRSPSSSPLQPPPAPSGPSKADFPCRQGSLGGWEPGTGGKHRMLDEAEEGQRAQSVRASPGSGPVT